MNDFFSPFNLLSALGLLYNIIVFLLVLFCVPTIIFLFKVLIKLDKITEKPYCDAKRAESKEKKEDSDK